MRNHLPPRKKIPVKMLPCIRLVLISKLNTVHSSVTLQQLREVGGSRQCHPSMWKRRAALSVKEKVRCARHVGMRMFNLGSYKITHCDVTSPGDLLTCRFWPLGWAWECAFLTSSPGEAHTSGLFATVEYQGLEKNRENLAELCAAGSCGAVVGDRERVHV